MSEVVGSGESGVLLFQKSESESSVYSFWESREESESSGVHLFQNSSSESKSAEDCVSDRGSGVQRGQVAAGVRSGAELQVQAVVAVMVVYGY